MGRTKFREFKLPDAINRCTDKNGFTQISNSFIRDPNISITAKMILILLLSNNDGWTSHINKISEALNKSEKTIKNALTELEQLKYLIRIQFRDKKTKKRKGSFWAYTDVANNFSYQKNLNILANQGYEVMSNKPEGKFYPLVKDNMELPDNHPKGKKLEGGFLPPNNTIKERKNTMKEFADAIPSKEKNKINKPPQYIDCIEDRYYKRDNGEYWTHEDDFGNYHRLPDEVRAKIDKEFMILFKERLIQKEKQKQLERSKYKCPNNFKYGEDWDNEPECKNCKSRKECRELS